MPSLPHPYFNSLLTTAAAFAMLFSPGESAQAQYYGFGYGPGVQVRGPGVRINVGGYGGYVDYGMPGPFYRQGYGYAPRRHFSYRVYGPRYYGRSAYVAPQYSSPSPPRAGGPVGGADDRQPTPADGPSQSPTVADELNEMSDAELTAALTRTSDMLNKRLANYEGHEGWQEYLDINEETATDTGALVRMLARFDSVTNDIQFARIYRLPEFRALHATLRAAAQRAAEDRDANGNAAETQPARAEPQAERNEEAETLPLPEMEPDIPTDETYESALEEEGGADEGGEVDAGGERSILRD